MLGKILDGRYKLIQELATGGFSQTYLAEDVRLPGNPKCVVKHFSPTVNDPIFRKKALELFEAEAEALQHLGKHDQIPQLFAYFEENKEYYLVQEFIEGHTLSHELLPDGKLSEARVAKLIQDVLQILKFVHASGIIHRDIKPNNLLRRHRDGNLVLIDFGTVKQIEVQTTSSPARKHVTTPIGTPGYMSNEQEKGNSSPNTDIYALGMVTLQALTGMHPSQFTKGKSGEVKWHTYANVSKELRTIIDRMVDSEPKRRYQTVDEVLHDIHNLPVLNPTISNQTYTTLPEARLLPLSVKLPSRQEVVRIVMGTGTIIGFLLLAIAAFNLVKGNGEQNDEQIGEGSNPPSRSLNGKNNSKDSYYNDLRLALNKRDWQTADAQTYELLLLVAGSKSLADGTFHPDELDNFPCADLALINQLWSDASQGNLGFAAQKKIYETVGRDWLRMSEKVGWRSSTGTSLVNTRYNKQVSRWQYVEDGLPNFKQPPQGHLPFSIREGGRLSYSRNALLQKCL